MVQADNNQKCIVKHFAIDDEHSFAQYSLTLAEESFNALTAGGDKGPAAPGKNKMLIQALDVSGSMSGAPTTALKLGAKLIGQRYFESE